MFTDIHRLPEVNRVLKASFATESTFSGKTCTDAVVFNHLIQLKRTKTERL